MRAKAGHAMIGFAERSLSLSSLLSPPGYHALSQSRGVADNSPAVPSVGRGNSLWLCFRARGAVDNSSLREWGAGARAGTVVACLDVSGPVSSTKFFLLPGTTSDERRRRDMTTRDDDDDADDNGDGRARTATELGGE